MKEGVIAELGERHSGFIRQMSVKENLFFHEEDLVGVNFTELKAGDAVTFTIVESRKGPYANQIRRA